MLVELSVITMALPAGTLFSSMVSLLVRSTVALPSLSNEMVLLPDLNSLFLRSAQLRSNLNVSEVFAALPLIFFVRVSLPDWKVFSMFWSLYSVKRFLKVTPAALVVSV